MIRHHLGNNSHASVLLMLYTYNSSRKTKQTGCSPSISMISTPHHSKPSLYSTIKCGSPISSLCDGSENKQRCTLKIKKKKINSMIPLTRKSRISKTNLKWQNTDPWLPGPRVGGLTAKWPSTFLTPQITLGTSSN